MCRRSRTYCHRRQYMQGFTAHIVAHRHILYPATIYAATVVRVFRGGDGGGGGGRREIIIIILKVFVMRMILFMETILRAHTHTHTHARTNTHTHARTLTHTDTNSLSLSHTHTHTHTYTHTYSDRTKLPFFFPPPNQS